VSNISSHEWLGWLRASPMENAILKSQIDKNDFLNSTNIIFLFMCISTVKSYLEEPIIF
jgi:hypothetical protein